MSRSSGGGLSTSAMERWPSGPRAPLSAASAALGLYLPELEPAPDRRRRKHTHASATAGSATAVTPPSASPTPSASAIREVPASDEFSEEVEVKGGRGDLV